MARYDRLKIRSRGESEALYKKSDIKPKNAFKIYDKVDEGVIKTDQQLLRNN
jgi:hypothetical protein